MFAQRKFILVPMDETEELQKTIITHKGTVASWKDRLDSEVTPSLVVVSSHTDYSQYNEMRTLMVPTVTSEWVARCVREGKLVPTRKYSPDPRDFLKSVVLCCAGLSNGDTDTISAGVRAAGGEVSQQLTEYTTHVVSPSLDNDIVKTALECDPVIAVVSPEWVDDCMKLRHQVPASPYLLDDSQKLELGPQHQFLGTFETKEDDTPRLAVQYSVREGLGSTIFKRKFFYLGSDLDISDRLQKTLVYLIETNDGEVVPDLAQASVYLGKYRSGSEFASACANGLFVGNVTWLCWMVINKKWDSPSKRLLHYPLVKEGHPEMCKQTVCISNYSGDARAYLQELAKSMGAHYSGALNSKLTTVLISARSHGNKYDAAKEWGIPVVNHLWLEESYANWHLQSTTLPRYTHLPSRLDLTTLIGKTHLQHSVLKQFFAGAGPQQKARPMRESRQAADEKLHRSMMRENEFQLSRKRGREEEEEDTEAKDTEKEDKETNGTEQKKQKSSKTKAGDAVDLKEPKSKAKAKAKETKEAKAKEARATNETKESKTKESTTKESKAKESKVKLSTKAPEFKELNSESSPKSKFKSQAPKSSPLKVATTGLDNDINEKDCTYAGIQVVEHDAEVLVAPRIMRTLKFLQCLAQVRACVVPEWLDESCKAGHPLPLQDYAIESETLHESLRRAQALRAKGSQLLSGRSFAVSPKVSGGKKVFEDLISAHGGTIARGGFALGPGAKNSGREALIQSIQEMDTRYLDEAN